MFLRAVLRSFGFPFDEALWYNTFWSTNARVSDVVHKQVVKPLLSGEMRNLDHPGVVLVHLDGAVLLRRIRCISGTDALCRKKCDASMGISTYAGTGFNRLNHQISLPLT